MPYSYSEAELVFDVESELGKIELAAKIALVQTGGRVSFHRGSPLSSAGKKDGSVST